jgi:NAD-dependent deacetylase
MTTELTQLLKPVRSSEARIVVLTGAGISAESGIPTFRGNDGYWVIGSRNYMPEEMATHAMFQRHPEQVWRWYLYRFGICRKAEPNDAHRALVELEAAYRDRFTLVTQNIDGLHRRAGSRVHRTYCIHGDAAYARCSADCGLPLQQLADVEVAHAGKELTDEQRAQLTCPLCKAWLRPHVLWFDECYDEENYRADSAVRAAAEADLLLVVGTSGATNLPMRIGELCLQLGTIFLDVNPDDNPFASMARESAHGLAIKSSACEALPRIAKILVG